MTLEELLLKMRKALEQAGKDTPALDARLLLRQGGCFSEVDLISLSQSPLSPEVVEKTLKLLDRRLRGEPISRIVGEREFWGLSFAISPDTLDPRPDTETLVDAALQWAMKRPAGQTTLRILDLGTGSGCILISLLKALPNATGMGVDVNPGALAIARENAARHSVQDRLEFCHGSWFAPLEEGQRFDLIVSNPPYIPESDLESLSPEVRNHDPILALIAQDNGLRAYKDIVMEINARLKVAGRAFFEIGFGQEKDLARLVDNSDATLCAVYPDLAGIPRVVEIGMGKSKNKFDQGG